MEPDTQFQQNPDDKDDEISLCDFPTQINESDLGTYQNDDTESFQFFTRDLSLPNPPTENILFFGKPFSDAVQRNRARKSPLRSSSDTPSSDPDVSLQKVAKFASPEESRRGHCLSLAVLGLARIPTEMDLNDIRTRLSRRRPPTAMFRFFEDTEVIIVEGGRGRWLCWLLKALYVGCRSPHATAVVKATFGCL